MPLTVDFGNQRWVLARRKLVWGLQPPVSGTERALPVIGIDKSRLQRGFFSWSFLPDNSFGIWTYFFRLKVFARGPCWSEELTAAAIKKDENVLCVWRFKLSSDEAVFFTESIPGKSFVVNVETPLVTYGRSMEEDEDHFQKKHFWFRTQDVLHRGPNPPHGAVSACCPQKTRSDGALYAIFSSINNSNWNTIYIRKDLLSRESPLLQSVANLQVKNETRIKKKKARQRR